MSGVDNVKRAMDWMHPNDRQSCRNCQHAEVAAILRFSRPELRCRQGGFFTSLYAICGEFTPVVFKGAAK